MRQSGSSASLRIDAARRRLPGLVLPCVLGLLASLAGRADTITVSLVGHITSVDPAIASGFTVGSFVVWSFQFDSTTVDSEPSPAIGEYFDALINLSVHYGSYDVSLGPQGGEVFTGLHSFGIQADAVGDPVAGFSLALFPVELVLSNPSDVFVDDAIPSHLELESFATRRALLSFIEGNDAHQVESSVDALIYTVPEPGEPWLLGVGVGWIGSSRRRRLELRRVRSRMRS